MLGWVGGERQALKPKWHGEALVFRHLHHTRHLIASIAPLRSASPSNLLQLTTSTFLLCVSALLQQPGIKRPEGETPGVSTARLTALTKNMPERTVQKSPCLASCSAAKDTFGADLILGISHPNWSISSSDGQEYFILVHMLFSAPPNRDPTSALLATNIQWVGNGATFITARARIRQHNQPQF